MAAVVQRYQIVSGTKILNDIPKDIPWTGHPYVVLRGAQFPAQARGNLEERHGFLTEEGGDQANIVNHPGQALSLRVSDDNNMAIEDTDLTQRQPKEFYATQDVVTKSNNLLQQGKSRFRLQPGGHALTILTWRFGSQDLVKVTPLYNQGPPDSAPQNCNAVAAGVLGASEEMLPTWVTGEARKTIKLIGGTSDKLWTLLENKTAKGGGLDEQEWMSLKGKTEKDNEISEEEWMSLRDRQGNEIYDFLAYRYVAHGDESVTQKLGANRHAQPEVGDAFVIVTMGGPKIVGETEDRQQVWDFRSKEYRAMDWEFHFGGVVARSGKDRITLENYARGDNRINQPDPRWYFQMFGEGPQQSFHEFYEAKPGYANPVTIVHKNPNR